mgnify:CR=1 FL=1
MTQPDEYWNPGAKRTFKIIEDNCPAKFYDSKVIKESTVDNAVTVSNSSIGAV